MNKILLLAASLWLAIAAGVHADRGGDVQKAIDEAKAAYEKADSVQGAWIDTPKLIKKAEEAAAEGDDAEALKFAAAAKKEADAGYAQAVHEKENWAPPPYLR
jgi:hypothetical protein